MTSKIYKVLESLKTSEYILAKQHLYIYASLFQKYIEPKYNYQDKFFTCLGLNFHEYINQNIIQTALLEASPRTGKTEFLMNILIPYLIGINQNQRLLLVAGNQTLKKKLRRLIERACRNQLYNKVFNGLKITLANDSLIEFNNGCLINMTTTNSMTPTGEGFHYIFLIDFLNRTTIRSSARKESAWEQCKGILSRTQNDPSTKLLV